MRTCWDFEIDEYLVIFEVDYFTRIVSVTYYNLRSEEPLLVERFAYGKAACGTFIWDSRNKKFRLNAKKPAVGVDLLLQRRLHRIK
jgi:hypothetical protein